MGVWVCVCVLCACVRARSDRHRARVAGLGAAVNVCACVWHRRCRRADRGQSTGVRGVRGRSWARRRFAAADARMHNLHLGQVLHRMGDRDRAALTSMSISAEVLMAAGAPPEVPVPCAGPDYRGPGWPGAPPAPGVYVKTPKAASCVPAGSAWPRAATAHHPPHMAVLSDAAMPQRVPRPGEPRGQRVQPTTSPDQIPLRAVRTNNNSITRRRSRARATRTACVHGAALG